MQPSFRVSLLRGVSLASLVVLIPGLVLAAECQPVARLVSLEGVVETKIGGETNWQAATLEQNYCAGDALRTGRDSRAAIRLINDTLLRLDSSSAITFTQVIKKERSILDLLRGAVHFISRTPRSLQIRTPYVNAAIEGTEFVVRVSDSATDVTVYEGRVVASNDAGSIELTTNQTARAETGHAPVRITVAQPRDAVAWALYYPPLPDQPGPADTLAQQTIAAIVQNRLAEAAKLAQQAIAADPQSAAAFMAQSYVDQAQFDIPAALANSRKAAELAPQSALTQARLSEVWLMTGDTKKAKRVAAEAVALDPNLSLTQSVLGFASLRDVDLDNTQAAFEKAIQLDTAAPLPRLGLGLLKIRRGQLRTGREEIETAALLAPNNALLRSYMGKAYYEEKRSQLASEQFAMAKELDPNDPTAWFYDSILLQTSNQPVKALEEINAAIARNDNRAVYRSSQLLDEDNASRNISLARIYDDLGFEELAIVEASESLNDDPANYSAHRLIADSFATRPRHEIARASEFLQSQLLQPLNINPAQPRLAETNLNILPGLVPLQTGFNEYNTLFDRNQTLFTLSGIGGTQDTLGDELVLSGIQNNIGYSLGQFHYETDGTRENKNAEYDIYNLFLQADISSKSSLQAELRHSESNFGDLLQHFNSENFSPNKENENEATSLRLGYHLKPDLQSDLLLSAIYTDKSEIQTDNTIIVFPDGASLNINDKLENESDIFQIEAQYIRHMEKLRLTTGAGHYESDDNTNISRNPILTVPGGGPVPQTPTNNSPDTDTRHSNGYLYLNFDLLNNLSLLTGISVDSINFEEDKINEDQLNPKLGLQWNITETTILRAAAFRNLTRDGAVNHTIETTHVAGFNQLFDDKPGSDTRRYALAIDNIFSQDFYTGLELSKREIESPSTRVLQGTTTLESIDSDEYLHRAYLYWTPTEKISVGTEVHYEQLEKDFDPTFADITNPNKTTTTDIPIFIHYYHPQGWFGKLTTTYVDQEVEFPNITGGTDSSDDQFWLLDASLGYRLPKRNGIVSLEARNLLDKDFNFQETDLLGRQRLPRFEPEQSIYLRFTLNY